MSNRWSIAPKVQFFVNGTVTTRTLDNVVGYPVVAGTNGADFNLAVAGDEANITGLVLDGPVPETIANATNSVGVYQVLHKVPAIVNKNGIRTTDIAGAAFNVTTIETRLKALNFEVRTIPVKSTTLS